MIEILNELKKDTSSFKTKVLSILIVCLMLVCTTAALDYYRQNLTKTIMQSYNQNKIMTNFLSTYDKTKYEKMLDAVAKPVLRSDLEKTQKEKLLFFTNNNLQIENISNAQAEQNVQNNEKIKTVECNAVVKGSWTDTINCVKNLEENGLVSIKSINFNLDETSLIQTKISYSIPYYS